jgi:hypothetical protein
MTTGHPPAFSHDPRGGKTRRSLAPDAREASLLRNRAGLSQARRPRRLCDRRTRRLGRARPPHLHVRPGQRCRAPGKAGATLMRRIDFEAALGLPSVAKLAAAAPSPTPGTALTEVELTWIEGRHEQWIRFGRVAAERILSRRTRVSCFRPGAVFAFVRWTSNDFGTIHSNIAIAMAVAPGGPHSTLPFVRPRRRDTGADRRLDQGPEGAGGDRRGRSRRHRRLRRGARPLAARRQPDRRRLAVPALFARTPHGVAAPPGGRGMNRRILSFTVATAALFVAVAWGRARAAPDLECERQRTDRPLPDRRGHAAAARRPCRHRPAAGARGFPRPARLSAARPAAAEARRGPSGRARLPVRHLRHRRRSGRGPRAGARPGAPPAPPSGPAAGPSGAANSFS